MWEKMKQASNVAFTQNGAMVYATTGSALLDFFAQGGALRGRSEVDIISLFSRAYAEDALLARKALFYFRDVRGGQGERDTFRTLVKFMAKHFPKDMTNNVHLIPFYGRWDDIYALFDTELQDKLRVMLSQQLVADIDSEKPSLMAKWLKSINTSSKDSRHLGIKTMKLLGLTPSEYRITLSTLRQRLDIVERRMSKKEWSLIQYDKLPSKAGLAYRKAFKRNDGERYEKFLEDVTKGVKKINTKTLYPYEILRTASMSNTTADVMWENLPNYIQEGEHSIAVVDTSGSMIGLPLEVAVSMGIYMGERNIGPFRNKFITFSRQPQLVEITGSTLWAKYANISKAHWTQNTNIKAVFDLILNTAIQNKIPQDEIPKKLYIISDMQFDSADKTDEYLFVHIANQFAAADYEMPKLIFWNVNAKTEAYPSDIYNGNVQLVSGCSPSLFTHLMTGEFKSPYDLMIDVLNSERYSQVK